MNKQELIERIKRLDESYLKNGICFKINRTTRRTRKSESSAVGGGLV